MKIINYVTIAFVVILLFLLITNPSIKEFKEQGPYYSSPQINPDFPRYIDPHFIVRKDANYFLFSHFTWSNVSFLGIAGNFFVFKTKPEHHLIISQGGQITSDRMVPDSVPDIIKDTSSVNH